MNSDPIRGLDEYILSRVTYELLLGGGRTGNGQTTNYFVDIAILFFYYLDVFNARYMESFMARKRISGPTEKELQILSILWKYGPSSVREVNSKINLNETAGYTTTLKLMQIMFEKKLLKRDESSKTHVYIPASPENLVQKEIIVSLLGRVFAGSTEKLVMSALSAKKVSRDELEKIKILVSQKEREL